MTAHHENARGIVERVHISGRLVLQTPAHFGNGEVRGEALVDMTLLQDEVDGRALIPGTTIAGALRNYLRERLHSYDENEPDRRDSKVAWLFGPARSGKIVTDQSLLVVDDALSVREGVTLRDGVRIEAATGTAADKAKFDIELLEAGTEFNLHFELMLTDKKDTGVLAYLAAALQGFENGEIRLGARKRRGYGQCKVESWTVRRYKLTNPADLCAWLETPTFGHELGAATGKIADVLVGAAGVPDHRQSFAIHGQFGLDKSSLMIRSGFGQADVGPDMEHMHASHVDGRRWPVVPGTSWAGILRHRALRIAKTITRYNKASDDLAAKVVDEMFGWMHEAEERGQASRITVDETEVKQGESLYQTRVRIDRFTGGAFETALFEEAPVYGKPETTVEARLHLRNPKNYEMGLLLLALKDLWTGDLPVGGEASIGRGRLQGQWATVTTPDGKNYRLQRDEPDMGLSKEQWRVFQDYVDSLWAVLTDPNDSRASIPDADTVGDGLEHHQMSHGKEDKS